jgi:class 3 adenylate cyclase
METAAGRVLVVDDNEVNRDLLSRQLKRQGHTPTLAENGRQALELMRKQEFDLALLDIMMPEMNGYQVLEHLKADPQLRHIPVIVISAVDDIESVVKCIELGAEDYLFKPFNQVLLRARIGASLEKKRLRDQEQSFLKEIQAEREKSERLLLNILPKPIAERLKQRHGIVADSFAQVSVLFADIVDFTPLMAHISPADMITLLNDIFSAFDALAEKHTLEKIKTIGDAYMVVGGLPTPCEQHAERVAEMALDMQDTIARFTRHNNEPFLMRIGIHTGPVVAGVIGTTKFIYDLWGDTVNTASRMESHGIPGYIQVTHATYQHLQNKYVLRERGPIHVKGKGDMTTYLLMGRTI